MSLTLIAQTGTIAFARNACVFQLQTDYLPALGVRSTLSAGLTDRFATNKTITITYTEPDGTSEILIFTAKAVYDDPTEIPDNSFSGTNTAYWNAVVAVLAAHPRIAPFFTVQLTGSAEITIRARSTASGWDIETTTNESAVTAADFAAEAATLPANYRVLFEVYLEETYRGGNYVQAAQLQGVPDASGYVWFDISSVLAARCRSTRNEPLVPIWSTDAPALADNIRRYYVRYTEEYGEPPVATDWTYSGGTKLAIDGGIAQAIFAESDWLGALDATDSLLTWMPDGRKIGMTQPEYLAWYNYFGDTNVYIEMQWYDITDNTESAVIDVHTAFSVRESEVALLPVSPTIVGLDTEPTAYKYRVRVTNGLAELSQWRTYYIDRDYYESERYLQYLNGFGVPECWRCTGEWGKKLKVDRLIAGKTLQPGYNAYASERFQFAATWENELVYRTGWLALGEAEALQELMIAGEVYDVSSEGYLPLLLSTESFAVSETRQALRSYQVSALARIDSRNYSKKKLTTATSGAWLDPDGNPWFDPALVAWEIP